MIRHALTLAVAAALASPAPDAPAPNAPATAADDSPAPASAPQPGLTVARGAGELSMLVPESERLVYEVVLDIALIGETRVGSFVLAAGVEEYRAGLPRPGQPVEASYKRAGWIRGEASGHYLGYSLEHTIEARLLPQEWPRVIVRDYQAGSENRRRELMYGSRGGQPTSWYRRDGHCGDCERAEHFIEGGFSLKGQRHCGGCKRPEHREWRKPAVQEIPDRAVDMVSAIHLARSLIRSGQSSIQVPLLDKHEFWDLTMTRAEARRLDTPAGSFHCRAVKIDPLAPEGADQEHRFKGLFGIHGTLSIWLEERTGVPVRIEGMVPLGPMNIDVAIELAQYEGTPKDFGPLE